MNYCHSILISEHPNPQAAMRIISNMYNLLSAKGDAKIYKKTQNDSANRPREISKDYSHGSTKEAWNKDVQDKKSNSADGYAKLFNKCLTIVQQLSRWWPCETFKTKKRFSQITYGTNLSRWWPCETFKVCLTMFYNTVLSRWWPCEISS